ncbi:uncharacterized protein LOC110531761 isoform X2 [Oncorhynchus mykiss]|uniref:uncharacterized protein LOC110531761 isoform X2 n=1 Tax=Oncorhynchus mykiss TaxID=8022 RepID=UPI001878FD48|nr:uncharacterized protein LOC110531761 isoform X2 [Oncorhynchus mykiss]
MSLLKYSPFAKEEGVCWTEKEALGLDIVVKEEEEEDVPVKKENKEIPVKEEEGEFRVKEEEDVTVNEEEKEKEQDTVFGVKEEGEITVTLKEEDETGDLNNTGAQSEDRHFSEIMVKRDQTLTLTAGRVLQGNQMQRRPNKRDDTTVPSVERVLLS